MQLDSSSSYSSSSNSQSQWSSSCVPPSSPFHLFTDGQNFLLACIFRHGGIAILLSSLCNLFLMTYAGYVSPFVKQEQADKVGSLWISLKSHLFWDGYGISRLWDIHSRHWLSTRSGRGCRLSYVYSHPPLVKAELSESVILMLIK